MSIFGFSRRGKSIAPPILSVPCLMRNPDACGVEWHLILEFQSLLFMEKFEESVGDYIWDNLCPFWVQEHQQRTQITL